LQEILPVSTLTEWRSLVVQVRKAGDVGWCVNLLPDARPTFNENQRENMSDHQRWVMTEKDILVQAEIVLARQPEKSKIWNYAEHADLIANIAVEHGLPSTLRNKFREALMIHGVGGNSSAFRQWLQKRGLPVKDKAANLAEKLL